MRNSRPIQTLLGILIEAMERMMRLIERRRTLFRTLQQIIFSYYYRRKS